jgi:hopanoid biosynthesis associated protein HpnK
MTLHDLTPYKPSPRLRLVVNADDFGRTETINAAVAQAHSQGILSSASLMVTAGAAAGAVRVAREHPALAVGLHLVVLGGRAALPPATLPHLVDGEGRFSHRLFAAGVHYSFSRAARAELAREMRAQFEAFRATGLLLSHVDGHHHMHLHPTVFDLLLPLAHEFGATAVRLRIADDLLLSLRVDRRHPVLKSGWKMAFTPPAVWGRRSLRRCPMPTADRVYGLMQTGCMTEAYLLRLLEHLAAAPGLADARDATHSQGAAGTGPSRVHPPLVEIFCHPSLRYESRRLGPNPGDLATLLSSAVRAAIDTKGILLTTYPGAAAASAGAPPRDSSK